MSMSMRMMMMRIARVLCWVGRHRWGRVRGTLEHTANTNMQIWTFRRVCTRCGKPALGVFDVLD